MKQRKYQFQITVSEEFEPQTQMRRTHQETKSEGHISWENSTGLYVNYGDPAT